MMNVMTNVMMNVMTNFMTSVMMNIMMNVMMNVHHVMIGILIHQTSDAKVNLGGLSAVRLFMLYYKTYLSINFVH